MVYTLRSSGHLGCPRISIYHRTCRFTLLVVKTLPRFHAYKRLFIAVAHFTGYTRTLLPTGLRPAFYSGSPALFITVDIGLRGLPVDFTGPAFAQVR